MRVLGLPGVAELGHRPGLADRHHDRVVAEALAAARLVGDDPLKRPGRHELVAAWRDRDDGTDVAGMPIAPAGERREQRRNAVLRPARRLDARTATETGRFDARVLTGDPDITRRVRARVACLDAGVLLEGVPVLDGWLGRLPGFDLPAGERVATRSFTASGLPGDRLVLGSAKLGDARRREDEQLAEQLT